MGCRQLWAIAAERPLNLTTDLDNLLLRLRDRERLVIDFSDLGDLSQRAIDKMAGAVFALDGDIRRLQDKVYLYLV